MIKEDNSLLIQMYGFSDGQHVEFSSILPLPGAKNGEPETALSSRTLSGWVTTSLVPPQGPGELDNLYNEDTGENPFRASFTSDFSAAFVNSTYSSDPLDQNTYSDVYRIGLPGGESSLASLPDTGAMTGSLYTPAGLFVGEQPGSYIAGNSADGSHVFFATIGRLPTAPGTPVDTHMAGNQTYERYAGHTYLVGVLPDGSAAPCGAEIGNGGETGVNYYSFIRYGAVSPDGSNIVFHAYADADYSTPECEKTYIEKKELYLREDNGTPEAKTVELPGQAYLGRADNGAKILSTMGPGGNAEGEPIYEYDVPTGQATTIGYGALLAYSSDGSRVYYIAKPGDGDEQELKVYDNGVTKTIPDAGPGYSGGEYLSTLPSQPGFLENLPVTTPDGSKLLFLDRANLTSYDASGPTCEAANTDYNQSGPELNHCSEAYIYDLDTNSFECASCNPSGTPPISDAQLLRRPAGSNSFLPPTTPLISGDGSRVFFETTEALVPQDTNGQGDVYEWEDGHIYLLSSGKGGTAGVQEINAATSSGVAGSQLVGVSADGDDVFFATTDHLLPQDIENSEEIYDARVEGGFPYTTPVYGCDSGQCQGPQTSAPVFAAPPSATFVGVGNPIQEGTKPALKSKPIKPEKKHKQKKGRPKKTQDKGKGGNRKSKGRQ